MNNKLIGVNPSSGKDETVRTLVIIDKAEGVDEKPDSIVWAKTVIHIGTRQCREIIEKMFLGMKISILYSEDSDTPIIVEEKK